MNVFRRRLIEASENIQYIEGFCVSPYPEQIKIYYMSEGTTTKYFNIDVNSNNGYFFYKFNDKLLALNSLFDLDDSRNKLKEVYLHLTQSFTGSLQNAFRRQSYLEKIVIKCLQKNNDKCSTLYYAFGINSSDIANGFFSSLKYIDLPNFEIFGSALINCNNLNTINSVGKITKSLELHYSPITLNSVINVLNGLQPVTNEELTFSRITSNLIYNSEEALQKIEEVAEIGWTVNLN